ncbi:MAG: BrxA/BrxB family bacilliredoxin [Saprospiraceae bacterium]|jgi:putative YphP/YqiW family bacilliredoxin
MYPLELVAPMARDLTDFGFEGLSKPEEVDDILGKQEGTVLLVVNSVCGCAAANARPAAKLALTTASKPDKAVTVFAGVHREATEKAREYLLPYPPSSPAIALFKDGQLVHMIERHHIEGRSAQMIADNLSEAMNAYCGEPA